jgi:hypothetical protein
MMEVLAQLGAGAVIAYIVYLIMSLVFKYLTETNSALATSLNRNSDVLADIKIVMTEEKARVRNAIEKIERRIDNGFEDTASQIAGVRQAIAEIQKSLDETLPIVDKDENKE